MTINPSIILYMSVYYVMWLFIVSDIFINSVSTHIKPICVSKHIYSTIRSPLGHEGRFILQLKPTPYSYLHFKKWDIT